MLYPTADSKEFDNVIILSSCSPCAGFLVDFIPFPVISGFTSAAAITIAFGQIKVIMTLNY